MSDQQSTPAATEAIMRLVFQYGAARVDVDRSNGTINQHACNDAVRAVRSAVERLAAMRRGVPEGVSLWSLKVAVDLLREVVGPLEVSAAIIEDEDGGKTAEALIDSVKRYVEQFDQAMLAAPSSPPAPSTLPEKEADGHLTIAVPGEASTGVPPLRAIADLLNSAMDEAVKNGADSRSMPDGLVAIAAWLAGVNAAPTPDLESIEQYRLQMAGISTAAIGYWRTGEKIHPAYDTLALRDVAKLYDKYDALYKIVHAAQAEPEAVAPSAASMLRALLTELKPLTAYGVVGSRDVDQARYQRAIAEIEKCLGATPTPSAQAPAAESGLAPPQRPQGQTEQSLAEQVREAQRTVAGWTDERRRNVQLQGHDPYQRPQGQEGGP